MPRPAVPPEKRRRVARACDSCKRRKERCNGAQPCVVCTRRRREHECSFSDVPARLLRPVNSESGTSIADNTPKDALVHEDMHTKHHQMAIDHLVNSASDRNTSAPSFTYTESGRNSEASAPIPDHARLLRDQQGKFMYIGDSASLSFLQSVRRIVSLAHGECLFTTDPRRHTILETVPLQPMVPATDFLPLIYEHVEDLVHQYLLATAGLMDMFEMSTFFQELRNWVNRPSRDTDERSCLYYLIMAIGAQVSLPDCKQDLAEKYFSRGRQQAFYTFTEAPSLMTVQAYTLITVYMLGACRRNGAFMNFGIACRAIFAIGMHLPITHPMFDEKECRERERTWMSVRMLDIFFSASLGRPPATCDLAEPKDGGNSKSDDTSEFSLKALALSTIYDRIVIEVYMKKALSTRLAESISEQLRSWTEHMPRSLDLTSFPSYDESRLVEIIAATHIISAYHWAIILLTRPFLTSQILQDMSRKAQKSSGLQKAAEDNIAIKAFADACVDSSLRGLDIVNNLLKYSKLPKRLPFLINAVCNIALVLGAAVFADQDKNFPLEEGLGRALKILRHFAPHDPHSSRYEQILTYLSDAVNDYIQQRNRQALEHRKREVSMLFGTVSHPNENEEARLEARHGRHMTSTMSSEREAPGSSVLAMDPMQTYDVDTPLSLNNNQTFVSDPLAFTNNADSVPDTFQPPSSVFGNGNLGFPDDAYLFMDQDPSIFSFWAGS